MRKSTSTYCHWGVRGASLRMNALQGDDVQPVITFAAARHEKDREGHAQPVSARAQEAVHHKAGLVAGA